MTRRVRCSSWIQSLLMRLCQGVAMAMMGPRLVPGLASAMRCRLMATGPPPVAHKPLMCVHALEYSRCGPREVPGIQS
jgi:hypothetical protein